MNTYLKWFILDQLGKGNTIFLNFSQYRYLSTFVSLISYKVSEKGKYEKNSEERKGWFRRVLCYEGLQ